MQAIVEQISQLFVSYNDYLSKNININSLDKKSLDKLLFDGFLNQNVPKTKTKPKTSYQNFFQIKRKTLSEQNPQLAFGAISKMISTEWRSMSKTEKDTFKTINITEDTNNVDEKSTDNTSIVFEVSTNHKKLNEPLPSSIERYFIENSDNESDVDDNDNDDGVRYDWQLGVRYECQVGVRCASQLGRANDLYFCRLFCCTNGCTKNIFEGCRAV